jgi:hypothetical protein
MNNKQCGRLVESSGPGAFKLDVVFICSSGKTQQVFQHHMQLFEMRHISTIVAVDWREACQSTMD